MSRIASAPVPGVSELVSQSSVNPAHAALGELPPVPVNSGVGERPDAAPSKIMCGGMERAGEEELMRMLEAEEFAGGNWLVGEGED